MAYLMVGRAATIRYRSALVLRRGVVAYSRVSDILLLVLTTFISLSPARRQKAYGTLKSTRMRTFSPLRLTSVMDSLEDRDIVIDVCGAEDG